MIGVGDGFDSGLLPFNTEADLMRGQLSNESRLLFYVSVENLSFNYLLSVGQVHSLQTVEFLLNMILGLLVDFQLTFPALKLPLIVFPDFLKPLCSHLTVNDLFVAYISFYFF